jgi:hypothetical protein
MMTATPDSRIRTHVSPIRRTRCGATPTDLDQPPLPAAELRAIVIAHRPQVQFVEYAHGVDSSSCRRGLRARAAGHGAAQRGSRVTDARDEQILEDGEAVKDAGRLEGPDDPEPRSPVRRQLCDVVIAQHHRAGGDRGLTADRREQRRLARAVRTNQANDLRHDDPHRGAADGLHASVAHADIAGIEQRVAADARDASSPVTHLAIRD